MVEYVERALLPAGSQHRKGQRAGVPAPHTRAWGALRTPRK